MSLEYDVQAEEVIPNVSTARAKRAQLYFDSSPGQSEHLMGPAELLLSSFAEAPEEKMVEGKSIIEEGVDLHA